MAKSKQAYADAMDWESWYSSRGRRTVPVAPNDFAVEQWLLGHRND